MIWDHKSVFGFSPKNVPLDKNPQKWDSSCGGFTKPVFPISRLQIHRKRHSWEGKVQKNAYFSFNGQRKAFLYKIVLRENPKFTKFSSRPIGALGLYNTTKQRSVWRIFRYILYSVVNKITFLNRNLWICKYVILRRFKHFEIGLSTLIWDFCWIIFAICSADFTSSLNGSTCQVSVTRIAFKD